MGQRHRLYLIMLVGWIAASPRADAAPLTVTGLRGGTGIDLGEVNDRRVAYEETTVLMVPNTPAQYRLTQMLATPLMNERGAIMPPERLRMEVSGGTTGTIRIPGLSPVFAATTELFVSGAAGASDRLTIIYSLPIRSPHLPTGISDPPEVGTYNGSFHYTFQAINGSTVATLTVPIRIRVNPIVMIQPVQGTASRLRFGPLSPGERSDPITISLLVTSNLADRPQLQQQLETSLVNQRGEEFPLSMIYLLVADDLGSRREQPLQPRMELPVGTSRTSVQRLDLTYQLQVPEAQASGNYQTMLRLDMLRIGLPSPGMLQIPLEISIAPVLAISISAGDGQQATLNFSDGMLGQASQVRTLAINIDSNLGQAYQVFQELHAPLTSDEGRRLPEDVLQCAPGSSMTVVGQMSAATVRRLPIYYSDARGRATKLFVHCQVHLPQLAPAGIYRSQLVYTVTAY